MRCGEFRYVLKHILGINLSKPLSIEKFSRIFWVWRKLYTILVERN